MLIASGLLLLNNQMAETIRFKIVIHLSSLTVRLTSKMTVVLDKKCIVYYVIRLHRQDNHVAMKEKTYTECPG